MARTGGILRELKTVFEVEIKELQNVMKSMSPKFGEAVQLIADSKGRVIVTGIGKSGIIANKIAATLTSTGTPAVYVHSGEALHGDIGIVSPDDIVLAIGKSGESAELYTLLHFVRKIGARIIAITASPQSRMAKAADIVLELKIKHEACPLNLAPTSSTTACLVLGDAIAVALMKLKKVSTAEFARRHPGGQLGRRLLLKVRDIMRTGERNPTVKLTESVRQMLLLITQGQAGAISVVGRGNVLKGLVSDYDVRKALERGDGFFDLRIRDIMNTKPMYVYEDDMAIEALDLMRKKPTNILPVLDRAHRVVGILHIMDLVSAGI